LGKVDNCQVGIFMGYVSRHEHALVNLRLDLPQEWTQDRVRCRAAGVPQDVKFQTRHEQALEMLDESASWLPQGWVTGDDEMARCGPFREALRTRAERYLLAVPSNTLIRDTDVPPPEYSGRGRPPKVPWQRVDRWCAALPQSAWTCAMASRDRSRLTPRCAASKPAHRRAALARMKSCSSRANISRREL